MASSSKNPRTTCDNDQNPIDFSKSIRDFNNDKIDQQLDSDTPLETILENQSHLYDLHTHLLGMGNTGFWIDSIIDKRNILPTHADFISKPELRKQLCPLIWNSEKKNEQENSGGFINGDLTAKFFNLLIEKNFPGCGDEDTFDHLREAILNRLYEENDEVDEEEHLVFQKLMENDFIRELKHYSLSFGKPKQAVTTQTSANPEEQKEIGDFTYDVVLTLDDLGKALGVTTSWMLELDDLIQSKVEEKLGLHTYQGPIKARPFRRWIVFNAREQKFQVVKGITVEILRELITVKANAPSQACALARAHLQNAFSMCNPDGTDPRPIDFDRFHGSFTPEFYPRRFSLKDSLYSQRLDVLASLLVHVLRRYQCCLPPVRYCELSIGVGDICRPWVFDILCSFPAHQPIARDDLRTQSNFYTMIVDERRFPHLRSACSTTEPKLPCIPNVTYKFLAGFGRQTVRADQLNNQPEAIRLLNDSPNVAIHYMLQEIAQSEKEQLQEEQSKLPRENIPASDQETSKSLFSQSLDDLRKLEKATKTIKNFKSWVVGLDLFGDEMGYPYCPFVTWPFRRYIRDRRHENQNFGLRIHCGENVPFADNDAGAYRHFIAHMYIVFRCLHFLQRKIQYGIRIGHGIAFARILSGSMSQSTHRKSSVLLAEMKEYSKHILKDIAFEINITSNEYLLGQALREGDYNQTLRLAALTELGIPIILSTDDDGIWPIDHCPSKHPGHHSLVAEYCRAFSLSLITSNAQLQKMLYNTNKFCFYSLDGVYIPMQNNDNNWTLPNDDMYASAIVFHPDLMKTILRKYYGYSRENFQWGSFYEAYRLLYPNVKSCKLSNQDIGWQSRCDAFARIAFVVHNTDKDLNLREGTETEFARIFPNSDNQDLREIFDAWINVRNQFMFPDDLTDGQHIITDSNDVFLSESAHKEEQQLPTTLRFANNHHNEYRLRVFSPKISALDKSKEFNSQLQSLSSETNISTAVYTTKNKDKYMNSANHKKIKLTINEKPTNRTNCSNVKEEHMLYVICRHASAATAYLHYIGNRLVKKYQQPATSDDKSSEQETGPEQTGVQTT